MSERMDGFLPAIVERLDTDLQLPHAAVLTQGDDLEEKSFYYVGKGDGLHDGPMASPVGRPFQRGRAGARRTEERSPSAQEYL